VQNLGNLLNSDWGVRRVFANNRFIETSYPSPDSNKPEFRFRGGQQTFVNNTDLNSRWRAQIGLRYILD
jgi:hypothetical protein